MQGRFRIGNGQTIGSFETQSNYFSTINADVAFAVLADGTIDHKNGRKAAILAVERCITEFYKKPVHFGFPTFYETLSFQIIQEINDKIYFGKKPNLSLGIVFLEANRVSYFSVGDNKIALYNGRELIPLEAQNGHCTMKKMDMVLLMSKGIYEALNEIELLRLLSKGSSPYNRAQGIIEDVNNKNRKTAGNATVILIEGGL